MTTTLSPDVIPRLPRGVRFVRDEARGRNVLLAPERVVEADEIACAILARIDGRSSIKAICADLAEQFGAERAEVIRDVMEFMAGLRDERLVEL